jgi:hypothetical protein
MSEPTKLRIELLTVEGRFQIGSMVVVVPDFAAPDGWQNRTELVEIVKPDGERYETTALFNVAHINTSDPPSAPLDVWLDARWRVMVSFPDCKKEEIPIGSKLFVSSETKNVLLGSESNRTPNC